MPMVHRDGYYEVLLRGGVRVPEEHYADLCVTEEYVLCCYRTRCYELNLPTTFFTPARDTDGRPYRMGWTGFCVWAEEPKKVFRIYDVDGETLYLKYGQPTISPSVVVSPSLTVGDWREEPDN